MSDFHLDPRYGSNLSVNKDIFLGSYNEVSGVGGGGGDSCYVHNMLHVVMLD